MILHLIEDLSSDARMQVSLLGHSLRVTLRPLPIDKLWEAEGERGAQRFQVNSAAVDELVDALIDDPEVQLILVPDLLEAEVYRYALHRIMCIGQFILSQLHINLFGSEVRLNFFVDEAAMRQAERAKDLGIEAGDVRMSVQEVCVGNDDLQRLMERIEDERARIAHELQRRQRLEGAAAQTPHSHAVSPEKPSEAQGDSTAGALIRDDEWLHDAHEFQQMAAQDRLSRSLSVNRLLQVPIEAAYQTVADINDYPKWMPLCMQARVLAADDARGGLMCDVGFGLETGTFLGCIGDTIRYRLTLYPPTPQSSGSSITWARVIADTPGGFAYGRRLVYDWRFRSIENGETEVRLDLFFQAKGAFFLPVWDSLQAAVLGGMMQRFAERAHALAPPPSDAGAISGPPAVRAQA
mmetsp:Transcript_31123/g.61861  ORF Transcript_31123/g.61861 Transcript_31123/m.61861 type:complete len:409 (+) Transcript_31123:1-1227(+)